MDQKSLFDLKAKRVFKDPFQVVNNINGFKIKQVLHI